MKFSIEDLFSKCTQIRRKLRICSHLLKKSFNGKLHFCAMFFSFLLLNVKYFCKRRSIIDI